MTAPSSKLALAFSCLGHLYMHFATAMFFTMALALEKSWSLPNHEVSELWILGGLLVGLCAVPAGMLGDRWSARGMMVICLLGMGGALFLCGLLNSPDLMWIGLAGVGFFAAIYHPVGIPWLIANANQRKGLILAINGMFGGLGPALAGKVTGHLIDAYGWEYAFFLPGIVIVITGGFMLLAIFLGMLPATGLAEKKPAQNRGRDVARVFLVLILTMFTAGIVYHATQAVLPKLFEVRWDSYVGGSASAAGDLVFWVYFTGAIMQVLGGLLADRFSLKNVYIIGWFIQIFLLSWIVSATGPALLIVALLIASTSTGILPAENMLLFRYSPPKHNGLVFGLKFILAFGAAPLALVLNSLIQEHFGGYEWLFGSLAVATCVAFLAAILLPSEKTEKAVQPAAAE